MKQIPFLLRGEFIPLDSLLKATGVAHSGGAARTLVVAGKVQVDGRDELRKTAKVRAGQVVALTGLRILVQADPGPDAAQSEAEAELDPGVAAAKAGPDAAEAG